MISSIFLLLSTLAWANFPEGCPAENLKSICDTLGKISNDKILVFADGTQMPACYLSNADQATFKEDQRQETQVSDLIYKALKKNSFPLREPNREEVSNLVLESERIRNGIQFSRDRKLR
jgi:hypothetical protein